MENATKALIMAGTVLISILLISFLLIIFRKGGAANAEYQTTISDAELAKFNSQFEVYHGRNNTYFDVITVCNLAYDIDKREEGSITVNVKIDPYIYKIDPNNLNTNKDKFSDSKVNMYSLVGENTEQLDSSDPNKGKKYKYIFKCTEISYNQTTGKVSTISFERMDNN